MVFVQGKLDLFRVVVDIPKCDPCSSQWSVTAANRVRCASDENMGCLLLGLDVMSMAVQIRVSWS